MTAAASRDYPDIPWPSLGSADPSMVTGSAVRLAEHFLWNCPDALWLTAGAVRTTPRPVRIYWDAEDSALTERVSDAQPWLDASYANPGWRVQRDLRLTYLAFSVARAIRCLPELVAAELHRRGALRLDARLSSIRTAAREIGWRPNALRRFATREVPFHPFTAALACQWLTYRSSTGTAAERVDDHE